MESGIINDENTLAGVQQYIIKCEASVQQFCMSAVCSSALLAVKHILAMILKYLSLLLLHR